jgi:hypothetical protein
MNVSYVVIFYIRVNGLAGGLSIADWLISMVILTNIRKLWMSSAKLVVLKLYRERDPGLYFSLVQRFLK